MPIDGWKCTNMMCFTWTLVAMLSFGLLLCVIEELSHQADVLCTTEASPVTHPLLRPDPKTEAAKPSEWEPGEEPQISTAAHLAWLGCCSLKVVYGFISMILIMTLNIWVILMLVLGMCGGRLIF